MADNRKPILKLLAKNGRVTSGEIASLLGISRQAAHRKLLALAESGVVVAVGAGRGAAFEASAAASRRFRFDTAALAEDRALAVIERDVPALHALDRSAASAVAYVLTELINNAIDHASAKSVEVLVEPRARGLAFEVVDDGVGAFERLRVGLGLASALDAVQEVSKGKVTTDRARHSGEGLFFTSKLADRFELEANGLRWIVDTLRDDVTVAPSTRTRGTRVRVELSVPLRRKLVDVFAAWTTGDAFDRTRTVVKLFAIGVEFVSRSEARRLLSGLDRFREVVLDFEGVESVGQGFADEVFRVFAAAHPSTRLVPERMSEVVAFMVRRATP